MKKKKDKHIRLTKYDRLQALVRNPQYIKDLKAATTTENGQKMFSQNKRVDLLKKYHLLIIIDQPFLEQYTREALESVPLFTDDEIVRMVTPLKSEPAEGIDEHFHEIKITPEFKEGKYLTLDIDLTKKKEDIVAVVGGKIDSYAGFIKKEKTRERETTCDPWKVWDMVHDEKKNFAQITREIFGVQGYIGYSINLSLYNQVRRAYKKAEALIAAATSAK